jgi:hypothetical protein
MTDNKRLSHDKKYIRPKTTVQDSMTLEEINMKLEDYIKIDEFIKVPLKTHIRYYIIDPQTKKKAFRLGGFLLNKDNSDKYIVLGNGKNSWSVQVKNTTFFKKKNLDEMKDEYKTEIDKLEEKLDKTQTHTILKRYEDTISKLERKNDELKIENKNIKKLLKNIKLHEIDKIEKKKTK